MIPDLPRLHAVTDDRVIAHGAVVARAAAMADAAGPALAVHLRSRDLGGAALTALARELVQVLGPHGSWLALNGRADVARATGARAIVSGRGGLAIRDIRRVAPAALVLRSVHDTTEIRDAVSEGADALIASGPDHVMDASVVRAAAAARPTIAIGGLNATNAPSALDAGAWGIAAVRALWDAPDPAEAARAFLDRLPKDDTVAVTINGEARRARGGASLAALLTDLGLDPRAVVVEHNRRIVRRGELNASNVAAGDTIELVHFVGGG